MKLFVVLETEDGLKQAHGRNKTYKTLAGAVDNGIREWGGEEPKITPKDGGAIVEYDGNVFVVVDIGDVVEQRALLLLGPSGG